MSNQRRKTSNKLPNELVFFNSTAVNLKTDSANSDTGGVDIEIILLSPNDQKQFKVETKRRKDRSSKSIEKFGPEGKANGVKNPTITSPESPEMNYKDIRSKSPDDTDPQSSSKEGSEKQREMRKSEESSPQVNESLLQQMERRYRDSLVSDDNTYIDYLDYF